MCYMHLCLWVHACVLVCAHMCMCMHIEVKVRRYEVSSSIALGLTVWSQDLSMDSLFPL